MKNPWVAIMRAAARGQGLRLSFDQVCALSQDGAIEACATNDMDRVHGSLEKLPKWKDADPAKYAINKSIRG